MNSVLSISPMSSSAFSKRPISLSVCSRNPENTSAWRANRRRWSAGSESHALMSFGRSASCVFAGITPSFFWRSSVSVRTWSQPLSYWPLYLSAHSFGTWCGACDRAGRVVDEERLVRRHRLLRLHPVDGLVGHVDGEVVVGHLRRIDFDHAVVDERIPLVGLAADEAVELVEALVRGPAIERARHAGFPGGGFVPLAEGAGSRAIKPGQRAVS